MYFKQGHENYLELVKQRSTYKVYQVDYVDYIYLEKFNLHV